MSTQPQSYQHLPLKEISGSTRNVLARYLDPETCALNKDYLQQNWTGLAELCNLDPLSITNLENEKSPTSQLLTQLGFTKPELTVGQLLTWVEQLGRYDVINCKLHERLEIDFGRYKQRLRESSERQERVKPVQVQKVTSDSPGLDHEMLDAICDCDQDLVVDDVNSSQVTYFDAFVSFCCADFEFVKLMLDKLESKDVGLKLCVNARDLLLGTSKHCVTADVIAERCRKVILVISPAYLSSRECDFQMKIALALSPGARRKVIVPVMYKRCKIPLVLYHITGVDYTTQEFIPWFWEKLVASIKTSPIYRKYAEEIHSLNVYQLDVEELKAKEAGTNKALSDVPSLHQEYQPPDLLPQQNNHSIFTNFNEETLAIDRPTVGNPWDRPTTIGNPWDRPTIGHPCDRPTIDNPWDRPTIGNLWDRPTMGHPCEHSETDYVL